MLTRASDSCLGSKQLDDFSSTGSDFDTQLLRTQLGMCCREPRRSRLFLGSNPDSARSADERKGVVANNFRRWEPRAGNCRRAILAQGRFPQ